MAIVVFILIAGIIATVRYYRREIRGRRARKYPPYRQRWRADDA